MPNKEDAGLFGNVIAFVLPGFLALWVISHYDSVSREWLGIMAQKETTVGAFLFAALASLGLGIFLSGARWIIFDLVLMRLLGVPPAKDLDQRQRKDYGEAYRQIVENHYKFYLFYANTAVALVLAFLFVGGRPGFETRDFWLFSMAEAVLLASARDALMKCRTKIELLLGVYVPPPPKEKTAA